MRSFLSAVLLALSGIAAVAGQPTCNRASDDLRGSTYIHMPYVGNSIACQLQRGDNSEAVRALQQQINMCYYSYQNRKVSSSLFVYFPFWLLQGVPSYDLGQQRKALHSHHA